MYDLFSYFETCMIFLAKIANMYNFLSHLLLKKHAPFPFITLPAHILQTKPNQPHIPNLPTLPKSRKAQNSTMNDPYSHTHSHRSKPPHRKSCTNLASCMAATIFLLSSLCIIIVLYFLLFKPKPPRIAVDAVQFPTFSVTNSTVSFTYFQFVTVTNPNRDIFTHYDSSLQLVSGGDQVGVVFIPAGKIDGGRIQHMSAKFSVDGYPIPSTVAARGGEVVARDGGMGVGGMMEIETRMKLVGRVKVLKVFSHRVDSRVQCVVAVELTRGSVLGLRC